MNHQKQKPDSEQEHEQENLKRRKKNWTHDIKNLS